VTTAAPADACAKSSHASAGRYSQLHCRAFGDEALLSRLFQHRFSKGGLEDTTSGNLFLAALTSITEDFGEAVRLSSEILLTRGHIYPATTANVELEALMEDGTRVRGETNITAVKAGSRNFFWILRCRAAAANAGKLLPAPISSPSGRDRSSPA